MSTDVPRHLDPGRLSDLVSDETGDPAAPPPNRIGPYQVIELIGKDACGIVCLARDVRNDADVELRLLPLLLSRDRAAIKRIRELAASVRTVKHPALAPVRAFDRDPDRPDLVYLVYDAAPGRRLRDIADDGRRVEVDRVIAWADRLADAIDHLHAQGMIHGSIGPDSITIGADDRPRMTGAVVLREVRRLSARIAPQRSPQQNGNGVAKLVGTDARLDDIVHLAATLYAVLSGNAAAFATVSEGDGPGAQPIPGLSAQTNLALLTALAPSERAQLGRARDLVQALRGAPIRTSVQPIAEPRRPRRFPKRALVTGALVAGLGITSWLWIRPLTEPPTTEQPPGLDTVAGVLPTHEPAPLDPVELEPPDAAADEQVRPVPELVAAPDETPPAIVVPDDDRSADTTADAEPDDAVTPIEPPALAALELQLESVRMQATNLTHGNHPAIEQTLLTAQEQVDRARERKQGLAFDEAIEFFEQAIDSYEQAMAQDEQATAVAGLGDELDGAVDAMELRSDDQLDAQRAAIDGLRDEGRVAFAAGEFEQAAERWRAARRQIDALHRVDDEAFFAQAARERWLAALGRQPATLFIELREEADSIAAAADRSKTLYEAGRFTEASQQWDLATTELRALQERHDVALCAVEEWAQRWSSRLEVAPPLWLEDASVEERHVEALGAAAMARQLEQAGRFDEACQQYSSALDALTVAEHAHAAAIDQLLADADRARRDGRYDDALDLLDTASAHHDAATIDEQRIAVHLELARARNTRETRDESLRAIEAALAIDPAHAESLALRQRVATLFAPRQGETRVTSIGQTLVFVEAGRFTMGSPADEPARSRIETAHPVVLTTGYWIARTEVTREKFAAFVEATGYQTDAERQGWAYGLSEDGTWQRVEGIDWRDPGFAQSSDHPVVCVSFDDASAFCAWLSSVEGRTVRLPTEAEWEHACRAGKAGPYPWGSRPEDGAGWVNAADATFVEQFPASDTFLFDDEYRFTAPVAGRRPNAWTLHGMAGNVQEWCLDVYDSYPATEVVDPTGPAPSPGAPRVLRGGSFAASTGYCRAAHRDANAPDSRFTSYGFRIVVDLDDAIASAPR